MRNRQWVTGLLVAALAGAVATGCGWQKASKRNSGGGSAGDTTGKRFDDDVDDRGFVQSTGTATGVGGVADPYPSGASTGGSVPTGTVTGIATGTGTGLGTGDCLMADAEVCKAEMEILRLTNEERARRGKTPLKVAPKMSVVARLWSEVQAKRGGIGHDGFPNQRERVFNEKFPGAQVGMWAENVAMTGGGGDDMLGVATEMYDMWRHSPGHYSNMMGDHDAMGVGVASDGDGGWYATEIFGEE
jgi:uncharacterized protein YkwD